MEFDSRLKALIRLADSESQGAQVALRKELDRVAPSLRSQTQYDILENDLAVLEAIGHRFAREVIAIIQAFIARIDKTPLTYSEKLGVFADRVAEYQNARTLIARAIDVLVRLRYLETDAVLSVLLNVSQHPSDEVSKKVEQALNTLAAYNIAVFQQIGAEPQRIIIAAIEKLSQEELLNFFSPVLTLSHGVLSPTIEGTSWTYKAVTISRATTPALPLVKETRSRAIGVLKRLYEATLSVQEKLKVVIALSDASRFHNLGEERAETVQMISENTVEVLRYFRDLVSTEHLQIVQKVEGNSYWMFYHAPTDEVRAAARKVEQALEAHAEYQIYKTLIGFEGVFLPWDQAAKGDDRRDEDSARRQNASDFIRRITSEHCAEWRARIIDYATTESDDLATFPVFYHFLESLAVAHPALALKLVTEDAAKIERFLIPLLRGLWAGPEQAAVRRLMEEWAENGRYLYQSMKVFLENEKLDRQLISLLLKRAADISELQTVSLATSIAVSNYAEGKGFLLDEVFLPALNDLTRSSNANWVFEFWYRPQARKVIENLSDDGIRAVLANLLFLKRIDYHAEEVLALIARRKPEDVLRFLCTRFSDPREESVGLFDAIPYEMHELDKPLSRIPAAAIRIVREYYDGDYGMFIHRGGHLLKTIFPTFSPEFEKELLAIVNSGKDDDIRFVLAVLRNYQGERFIHETAKAVLRTVPSDSPYQREVGVALMTTGVVTDVYGVAESYERKKLEVQAWLSDPHERVRAFAKSYIEQLDEMILADRKRADEEIALRKHRYGE